MDVDDLPDADRLWWPFAVRAALASARDEDDWSYDPTFQLLKYDADGHRLRMQRLYGGRSVLWGSAPGEDPVPRWTGVPGWATSDAVHHWLQREGASFLAWHLRGEWDTATPEADLVHPLRPLLATDLPHPLVTAARSGSLDAALLAGLGGIEDADRARTALDVLTAAHAEAPPVQGTVRRLLAVEIRAQMERTRERDRLLPQCPVTLVRWARVADLPAGFQHVVHQQDGGLEPALGNSPLREQFRVTLVNVLERLFRDEALPESGAWLFARVTYDGTSARLDRAFDSRPDWCEDDGPSLDTLAAEMAQRAPEWRPAWSLVLPRS